MTSLPSVLKGREEKLVEVEQAGGDTRLSSPQPIRPQEATFLATPPAIDEAMDDGFDQMVKGLYRMWASSQTSSQHSGRTKSDFVQHIQRILDTQTDL